MVVTSVAVLIVSLINFFTNIYASSYYCLFNFLQKYIHRMSVDMVYSSAACVGLRLIHYLTFFNLPRPATAATATTATA